MIWSNTEYIALRLVRRFLLRGGERPIKDGAAPFWRLDAHTQDPEREVQAYADMAARAGLALGGLRAVELGCGATNATGYAWTARFGGSWTGVEPVELLDTGRDAALLERLRVHNPHAGPEAVSRVRDLAQLDAASADVIVSNSVLEHQRDPQALFRQCRRVLVPGGSMLHRVDYRDHFFKYPFQFLTFSQPVWDNLLDPGDLPRHRLDDHLAALDAAGFNTRVLARESDPRALNVVAPFLDPLFAGRDRDMLATTVAWLRCEARF